MKQRNGSTNTIHTDVTASILGDNGKPKTGKVRISMDDRPVNREILAFMSWVCDGGKLGQDPNMLLQQFDARGI